MAFGGDGAQRFASRIHPVLLHEPRHALARAPPPLICANPHEDEGCHTRRDEPQTGVEYLWKTSIFP